MSMRFTGRKTGLLLTQRPGGIAVRQRIQRVIQGRMHREMGRLFHHEGKSVLVDHIHRDVVLRRNAFPLRRQFKGDNLPGSTRRLARMGVPSAKKPLPRNFTARDRSVETLHLRRKPRSSIPSASGGT